MDIYKFIKLALEEDIREGDHTTLSCIPSNAVGKARLLVKSDGIIAGVEVAKKIFEIFDNTLFFEELISDGSCVKKGDIAFIISGKSQSILTCERTVLNCMQRMSGIATQTNKLVNIISGYKTKLLDTRKTTPNFRIFEKMAVRLGGAVNHRFGLYDMILIKDNHIDYAGGIESAINSVCKYLAKNSLNLKIEIEARNLKEVKEILKIGNVHRIMLDNFSFEDLREAVMLIDGKYETEASGGITEETILDFAKCGVDFISVGALTHQVSSLDLSLKAF